MSMNDKKVCYGCGELIQRRFFTMVDKDGKDVYVCPRCRKIWEKAHKRGKDHEHDK